MKPTSKYLGSLRSHSVFYLLQNKPTRSSVRDPFQSSVAHGFKWYSMEQIATSPLLTPTTALFNSFLDFSSNDSPDAWSGGDGSVFSHTGEQHSNARQKQSRSNSADEPDASVQANDDCFGEDYFLTDLKDLDSGGLGSPGLHMRLSLGPPEERQKFPFSSSLLSPNSMAIIERNKMEHWEISQEMERQYRNGRSDSDPLSPMDDYSSYLAE